MRVAWWDHYWAVQKVEKLAELMVAWTVQTKVARWDWMTVGLRVEKMAEKWVERMVAWKVCWLANRRADWWVDERAELMVVMKVA